jgi:hypothetical protein
LTDDKWYDDHERFTDATDDRLRYHEDPTPQEIQAANKLQAKLNRIGSRSSLEEPPPGNASLPDPSPPRGAEKLELHKGRLIARDIETNAFCALTDDEIRHQVEIVSCKDKHCSAELQGRDINEKDLLVPAVPPPSLLSVNRNAVPTFTSKQSMRTETRPRERTKVKPVMPVVTI